MPIGDLPNEILQLIFNYLVIPDVPLLAAPPCRVAEVCHLWHSQALLIPEIFDILPVISLTSGNTTVPRRLLTANRPLSFALDGVRRPHKDDPNLRRIVDSSATWEHAEILGVEPHFSMAPLEDLSHGFPQLHTLRLQISNSMQSAYAGHIKAFEHARSLRHLELECLGALTFKVPYEQLVEYVERSGLAIAIRTVLSPGSQVQSLSFGSLHPQALPIPYNINLPMREEITRLTSLNLYLQPETVKVLMCRLTLPSLTRLRVVSSSPSILGDIMALVSRSRCPLGTLSLRTSEVGTRWNLSTPNTETVPHIPLLNLCPQLRKLELDRLDLPTLQNVIHPSSSTFLPDLRECIAHLSSIPGHFELPSSTLPERCAIALPSGASPRLPEESVPAHGDGGSSRRVPFVRLIFRSPEDRAIAHFRMEGAILPPDEPWALDPRLEEIMHFLSSSSLPKLRTGCWWWNPPAASKEPSPSSSLDQALSYLESDYGPMHDPWQVLLSRVYIPLDKLREASSEPASLAGLRRRVEGILHKFDVLFKQINIEWKSENEVTLVRMGHPALPTVGELLDAEKVYPGTKATLSTAPWGFVDLTKHIGSAD
ncbi:hypothetical protein FA13DRAFT_150096 [Coprinellus micaceus]|uniref:F-box domain-containing protein n=1 Tax=Coprinellus micaceus TaxID=71717 RepID=A0A4Y7TGS0_COPMI|nr:hypothetical protein FA13DRAFT_150096 [Coprinellus micaceus]